MATAILPALVVGFLASTPAELGLIEGCADALTGLSKLAGGLAADDPARRRVLATGGYTVTAAATATLGAATAVWQVGGLRAIAWAARGLRSPARDALLADLAPRERTGRAYGVERAGDNLGAVVGPLLGGTLAAWIGLRPTLFLSVLPGLLAAVAITLAARASVRHTGRLRGRRPGGSRSPAVAARRTRSAAAGAARTAWRNYRALRGTGLSRAIAPAAFFEAGQLAATLLILRAEEVLRGAGLSPVAAISAATVLYAGHNLVAALVAVPAGSLVDRWGARRVLALGAGAYVLAYAALALPGTGALQWAPAAVGFDLAGAGVGAAEPAESVLVLGGAPADLRGSAFGVFGLVQAGGDITASVVGGLLYGVAGPAVCFGYAAAGMAVSTTTALAGSSRAGASAPSRAGH